MAKQPVRKRSTKKPARTRKTAKGGAPTKSCPKCSKTMHAATGACECGYKFPIKRRKNRVKKAARSLRAVTDGALSQKLAESIKVVEKASGLEQAKKMLAAVKELESLK